MSTATQPRVDVATRPEVTTFFDEPTNTLSYVVKDPASKACAVIDSVMDLDYPSGSISFGGADQIIAFITDNDLELEWILETHVHADHLSAAPYIQQRLGGKSPSVSIYRWSRTPLARYSLWGRALPGMAPSSMYCCATATRSRSVSWPASQCTRRAIPLHA